MPASGSSDPLQFYQTVGTEEVVRARLGSIISGSLRRVIGNVELQAVVSDKRAAIMRQIRDEVNAPGQEPSASTSIDVRIRRADLPEENSQAVFDRMKSERQREAAQFRAEGARQAQAIRADADRQRIEILADAQKQSQILRGEGDAESIKIYADAYNRDRNFFAFYRSLEAYRDGVCRARTRPSCCRPTASSSAISKTGRNGLRSRAASVALSAMAADEGLCHGAGAGRSSSRACSTRCSPDAMQRMMARDGGAAGAAPARRAAWSPPASALPRSG